MAGPVVGRRDELAVIAAAAAQARRGEPRVVSVTGEAGAGKTALVRQAIAALDDATVVTLQADELAADLAYATVHPLVAADPAAAPFEVGLAALDAIDRDAALAVLVVEDLHWADRPSRQALAVLARRLDEEAVLVVTTARPDHLGVDDGWDRVRTDPERTVLIDLTALRWTDVAELAASRGVTLDEHAARRLHRHTEGNPLYVTAMLDELPPEALGSLAHDLPAPRTYAASVVARVAALPDGARALLESMAVLNRPAPVTLLASIGAVDEPRSAVDALCDAGLAVIDPRSATTTLAFGHPLIRSAVHADMSASRRREVHQAAARSLGPRESLVHRVEAADAADDGLADELEAEAAVVGAESGPVAGARLLRSASDLSSQPEQRQGRLLRAARLLLLADDQLALAGIRAQVTACEASATRDLVLGQLAWNDGDDDGARLHLERSASSEDPALAAEALTRLASIHVTRYESAAAVDTADRALALAPVDPVIELQASAYRALGIAQQRGALAGLADLARRLPGGADDVSERDISLLAVRGLLHSIAGQHRAAVADLETMIRRARPGAFTQGSIRAHLHLSTSLFALGRWDEALVHARVAVDFSADHPWERAGAHACMVVVLAARGAWDDAGDELTRTRAAAGQTGNRESRAALVDAAVSVAVARDDAAAALDEVGFRPDPIQLPPLSTLSWYGSYAGALIATGHLGEAADWIDALETGAGERGLRLEVRVATLRGRLAAATGDAPAAIEALRGAVAAIGPDTAVLDQAEARTRLARMLRRSGQRKEAVAELRAARSLLEPLGAAPFVDRLDQDLDGAGLSAGQRGGRRSPLDLTPREQDVATLATTGRSNKEIAAELYVSVKAVEYHLRNVFGKLGIDSRRELSDHIGTTPSGR
ncbi:MAG TPA: AAA family ATPase [Acidimicrobiales bacterium]